MSPWPLGLRRHFAERFDERDLFVRHGCGQFVTILEVHCTKSLSIKGICDRCGHYVWLRFNRAISEGALVPVQADRRPHARTRQPSGRPRGRPRKDTTQ